MKCWLRVWEVLGTIHHTKEVKKWYQWFPCLALIIKRETLTLSQIAIIISLRALWKIDLFFFKYCRNKQANIDAHRTGLWTKYRKVLLLRPPMAGPRPPASFSGFRVFETFTPVHKTLSLNQLWRNISFSWFFYILGTLEARRDLQESMWSYPTCDEKGIWTLDEVKIIQTIENKVNSIVLWKVLYSMKYVNNIVCV